MKLLAELKCVSPTFSADWLVSKTLSASTLKGQMYWTRFMNPKSMCSCM
jgi:hypothetical protein